MAKIKEEITITGDQLAELINTHQYPDYAAACEGFYAEQMDELIAELLYRREVRFVLISGPTNSGKTTSTSRLMMKLSMSGRECKMISLDDYYVEGAVRYDKHGRPDYESVDTISLNMLSEDLRLLQEGKPAWIPHFDFKERKRIFHREQKLELEPGEIVLVEGLHALSPTIREQLNPESCYGVMLMPNSKLITRSGMIAANTTRKLRRISRDHDHRDTRALETIDFWPMVDSAEKVFIPQYMEIADVHINTALPYEYALTGPRVRSLIQQDLEDYEHGKLRKSPNVREELFYANIGQAVEEAKMLEILLGSIPEGDPRVIPNNSVLHEFL
ncbi:MAG: nucleoside kinase [Eubacteriales bacterium]|nr:nucleoside kinase [Eubacteriales bacterium]